MKNFPFFFFTLTFSLISFSVFTHKDGPPSGVAGEPPLAETCAVQGCHGGSALNSGGGTATIACKDSLNTIITNYQPNHTYTITLSINEGTKTRYGFEAIIMRGTASNATSIGTIIITQPNETQLLGGSKINILHKLAGIDFPGGIATWTFNWKAPQANLGIATIYAAFNAANLDQKNSGDEIYIRSLALAGSGPLVGIESNLKAKIANPYPNPTKSDITFVLNSATSIIIYNLNNEVVKNITTTSELEKINIDHLPRGIYIARVISGNDFETYKFMKQ